MMNSVASTPKPKVTLSAPEQTSEIASLYRACFPTSFRSRVGQGYCHALFSQLVAHPAYRVLVVTLDSRVLGFAVLHVDRLSSVPPSWQIAFAPQLAWFGLRHPRFVAGRLSNVLRRGARRRRQLQTRVGELREGAYLDDIAVSDAARGRGIGAILLEACIDETRRVGVGTLRLTVDEGNEAAIRLYRRMGFEEASRNKQHQTRVYSVDVRRPII